MKAIFIMFDSLNRHFLPSYGCDWTHAPNFERLAERTAVFDRSYVCSMPCMPARRDFHTGRPNFLHRSWGPLEPFDDSVPRMLKENGISSHLVSDHQHYWEDGGATYHTQYSTWQFFRGQEGDPCIGQVEDPPIGNAIGRNADPAGGARQDRVNRQFIRREEDQPQSKTFGAGIDFVRRNGHTDNWYLQIETFDPHEPFFSQRKFKDQYPEHYARYRGPLHDWPVYRPVDEPPEMVEHMRFEYASLLSMCDSKLGDILDLMDAGDMWDAMLVVWTDHGFLLGEHDCWAKMWMPFYEEVAHTPLFVWDPRSKASGERRQALVQPAIDLGPTLLDYFGMKPTSDMTGHPLRDVIADDSTVREAAIFGMHGHQGNVTDGRYVYMREPALPENQPLFDYTLMPTHMRGHFSVSELEGDNISLAEPFGHTKGCRTMKIPCDILGADAPIRRWGTQLFDLEEDPQQEHPIQDTETEERMTALLRKEMVACGAPEEQFERLGL